MKLMLCENGKESLLDSPLYAAELKADGTHIRAKKNGTVRIFGRPKKSGIPEYTERLPELVEALGLLPGTFELVGEAVVYKDGRTWFEGSQRRCSTQNKSKIELYKRKYPALLLTFDITELDGKDLKGLGYEERKKVLFELLDEEANGRRGWQHIRPLAHVIKDKRKFFDEVVKQGEEGVILKRLNSTYERRRSKSWLKVKHWQIERLKVVGFTEGKPGGKRDGLFGSLVVAKLEDDGSLVYRGKVGSGFNDAEVRKIYKMLSEHTTDVLSVRAPDEYQPVDMDLEVTVKFYEETKNGVIRFPSLLKDDRNRNMIHYETTIEPTTKGRVVQSNLKTMLNRMKE